jgi:cholesterol transport system auxiliary component
MNRRCFSQVIRIGGFLLGLAVLGGCNSLLPDSAPQVTFYSLDSPPPLPGQTAQKLPVSPSAPSLVVSPTRSAPGLDSQRIIYLRQPHTFEYFANSEWADLPARMLTPLIVGRLEQGGAFRAVLATANSATGDLRLDTELLRLQHDFTTQPSRVRVTLRAYLVDNTTRQVLTWQAFDAMVVAGSEDAYGGVVAANSAVQRVLEDLARFTAEAAGQWQSWQLPAPGERLSR